MASNKDQEGRPNVTDSAAEMGPVTYTPIGVIRSEHHEPKQTPIQPVYARGCEGRAEILPQYAEGLKDLDSFSHLWLVYHLHQAGNPLMTVVPFTDDKPRGVFSTRHPRRPNPIGLSLVRLVRVEGTVLRLSDVDILDGTPLLDIKPYIPRFERTENATGGWTAAVDEETARRRGRRDFQGGQP
jgi:tRNA-Thr(GGU) m(6)t(6)A37 methyltransferase TsaA